MKNNAKASTLWRRLMSVTGERRGRPTIGPQRNDLLRDLASAIVREDFDDNVSRATKALGLSGGTLGDFLRGDKGAGMRVIEGLASTASCTPAPASRPHAKKGDERFSVDLGLTPYALA